MYNGKKITATIEARMTSSRLPGKVLMPLAGKPALERMIERLKRSKYLDDIVIATTVNNADDEIVRLAEQLGVKAFRGSEDDVMGRVLNAAMSAKTDIIVELTGDCPLMDSVLVDRGVEEFFSGQYDCAANVIKRSFPDGFDVQVFPVSVLAEAEKETSDPLDREHVSYFIYKNEGRYKINHWFAEKEYTWPELRVTLDEKNDYELINAIFEKLLPVNEKFSYIDVINLLRNNPELSQINKDVKAKHV
ncbi:MAG: glycosyltransferase family protein [Candidatus Pacebacteria bacterium]|nr:glycosyltransferase family protein [Candidatus Paceibacterota bacterium]